MAAHYSHARSPVSDDGLAGRTATAVRGLTPGYFALVIASGIVSVGTFLEGFHLLSRLLLVVGLGAFAVLAVLPVWRLVRPARA